MKVEIQNSESEIKAILNGRFDTAAATEFAKDMQPLINEANKTIVLDCTNLEFISSSGLRHFLTIRKASIAQNGEVIITGMNDDIKQVFAITGFLSLFKVQ